MFFVLARTCLSLLFSLPCFARYRTGGKKREHKSAITSTHHKHLLGFHGSRHIQFPLQSFHIRSKYPSLDLALAAPRQSWRSSSPASPRLSVRPRPPRLPCASCLFSLISLSSKALLPIQEVGRAYTGKRDGGQGEEVVGVARYIRDPGEGRGQTSRRPHSLPDTKPRAPRKHLLVRDN